MPVGAKGPSTVASMQRVSDEVEQHRRRHGSLPADLDAIRSSLRAGDLEDSWGQRIHYLVRGADYTLASAGPDGGLRTVDDIVFENGRRVQLPGPPEGDPGRRRPPSPRQP